MSRDGFHPIRSPLQRPSKFGVGARCRRAEARILRDPTRVILPTTRATKTGDFDSYFRRLLRCALPAASYPTSSAHAARFPAQPAIGGRCFSHRKLLIVSFLPDRAAKIFPDAGNSYRDARCAIFFCVIRQRSVVWTLYVCNYLFDILQNTFGRF